jgi:hypothetical protein
METICRRDAKTEEARKQCNAMAKGAYNTVDSLAVWAGSWSCKACSAGVSNVVVNSSGTAGTIQITANNPMCFWYASPSEPWLTIPGEFSAASDEHRGTKVLSFTCAPNENCSRTAQIKVTTRAPSDPYSLPSKYRDQLFPVTPVSASVTQPPACNATLSPISLFMEMGGGSGSFTVTTSTPDCPWSVTQHNSWITITSGQSGTGPGTVSFRVNAYNANARERYGSITVECSTFAIRQKGKYYGKTGVPQ